MKGYRQKKVEFLNRDRKAVTLTELLVAIGVVSLLGVLLFPTIKKARTAATAAQCIGNLRQLGTAAKSFVSENSGLLPYNPDNTAWVYNLGPYLDLLPTKKTGNEPFTKAFLCPDDPSKAPRQQRTYRYNQSFPSAQGAPTYGRSNYVPSRATEIVKPSTHAMMLCVAYTGPRALDLWRFDEALWKEAPDASNPPDQINNFPRPHHQGKAVNILYSDGHAAVAAYPLAPETWHFDGR